ncbi:MAG: c-type cytochrome [Pseudomonadota bacterium]
MRLKIVLIMVTLLNVGHVFAANKSGAQMYEDYCAVCHGENGDGNGKMASALTSPATNLTKLSANNGGQFPKRRVRSTIDGRAMPLAHGIREMPVWGRIWRRHGEALNEAEMKAVVINLLIYLESIQQE